MECFGRVRVREDCCWGGALKRSAVFCELNFLLVFVFVVGKECCVLRVEIFLVLVFVVRLLKLGTGRWSGYYL